MMISIGDIRAAATVLEGHIIKTPLIVAPRLSDRLNATIFLKLENLQYTGSFKDRGALVKLLGLNESERRRGVIAASAGNHAQGVAYHAKRLGIPATIVMPKATSFTKIECTAELGAHVLLEGASLAEATAFAEAKAQREGLVFVHPYDDSAIIAGQGTVALEMLSAEPGLEVLIVPIGGGGLIAGIATAAKTVKPELAIFGVEAAACASMYRALRGEGSTRAGSTLAEGIAVERPGKLTEPVIRTSVEDIFLVSEDAIERAIETLLCEEKIVAEGAGAAPLAALADQRDRFQGKKIGLVISGGNIDSRVLSSVLLRGLVRGGRIIRLRIELLDQSGSFHQVTGIIAEQGANIIEAHHQRLFSDVPIKYAELDLMIETRNAEHAHEIMAKLASAGFKIRMLSSRSAADAD